MTEKVYLIIYIILYIALNTVNTYLLTHQRLNRYIAPFKHTFSGVFNALIGNVSILILFTLPGIILINNAYSTMLYLLILTFLLNIFVLALSVFNLFYGTAFSKAGIDIFKNPTQGISKGMFREILGELILYFRIVIFMPTIVLAILFFSAKQEIFLQTDIYFSSPIYLVIAIVSLVVLLLQGLFFDKMFSYTLPIESVKSTFAIQTLGVYPYYLSHLLGIHHNTRIEKILHISTQTQLFETYDEINKNKDYYPNIINQRQYGRVLKKDQVHPKIKIDESLLKKDSLTGLLKGRNLILVQVESINQFLLELKELQEHMPFLNSLLKESVQFTSFYTSVGIGVSADAEISALTGLYPSGISNLYWNHYQLSKKEYRSITPLTSLPKYFSKYDYVTKAIHGDSGAFYNRKNAYKDIIGFNHFLALEDIEEKILSKRLSTFPLYEYEYEPNKKHISPWISDLQLASIVAKMANKEKKPFMYFPITMMPHIPYEFNPEPDRQLFKPKKLIKNITQKYLNFTNYYDEIFKRFFIDKDGNNITAKNTVYLFYGDHGSGLKNGDLNTLFGRETKMSNEEERIHLLKVAALLYVPGETIGNNEDGLYNGLIKGIQPLVRGQVDIYRTIIELFDLPIENDFYFGTHLLSSEKTYSIDNKLLDIVTDEGLFSMRNTKNTYPKSFLLKRNLYQHVKTLKLLNDLLYKNNTLEEELNQFLNDNKENDEND
ncbi:MAG: LTA synthase family protein [Acholeplasmataceae bacterium]